MDINTTKAIIGAFGCMAIGIACYSTKSGLPLWGLFLLVLVIESI